MIEGANAINPQCEAKSMNLIALNPPSRQEDEPGIGQTIRSVSLGGSGFRKKNLVEMAPSPWDSKLKQILRPVVNDLVHLIRSKALLLVANTNLLTRSLTHSILSHPGPFTQLVIHSLTHSPMNKGACLGNSLSLSLIKKHPSMIRTFIDN